MRRPGTAPRAPRYPRRCRTVAGSRPLPGGRGPRAGRVRGSRLLGRRVRLDLVDAGDDLLGERVDLLGQLGGALTREVVGRDAARDAALEGADVGGGVDLPAHGTADDVLDRGGHLLHHGCEDDRLGVLVGGVGLVAVGVDPDHLATLPLLGGGQGARAHGAGHRHHDVRAGVVELVGDGLALGLVLEVAGDRALLALLVPAHGLDIGVVGVVVMGHAVHEAVHEDGHGRDVHAAVGGDLAGLAHAGGEVSGQEGGLGGVELDRLDVVDLDRVAVGVLGGGVHDREVDVRVRLGSGAGGGSQQEADREDQVAALGDHVVDVRGEVGVGGGLGGRVIDAVLVHGVHQAVVAGLVEGLVVPAAGVGDHAGLEIGRGAVASAVAPAVAAALFGGGATGGQGQDACARQSERALDALHEVFLRVDGDRTGPGLGQLLVTVHRTVALRGGRQVPVRSRRVNCYEIDAEASIIRSPRCRS